MYAPQYWLRSFETLPVPGRIAVVGRLLDALVAVNMADREPRVPVSKAKLLPGVDAWQDAARIAKLGGGTCPSLVAARVAELRKSGESAASWSFGFEGRLYVVRADGTREDPAGGSSQMATVLTRRALWTPTMELVSFATTPASRKMQALCKLLDVLHEANVQWLNAGGKAPKLYDSGIKYVEEELGKDQWQDIPETVKRGSGDCEDLASYRVSELRAAGEAANHAIEHRYNADEDIVLYHILVRRADGSIEDPSCKLGMGGACNVFLSPSQVKAKVARQKQGGAQSTAGTPNHVGVAPVVMTPEDVAAAALRGSGGTG